MKLESPAFSNGAPIPRRHTCQGEDLSPPLTVAGVPSGTASLSLLCEDPDAPGGTWLHWSLTGLKPGTLELPEGLPRSQFVMRGASQGLNDFGKVGWGGPCPPPGKAHRYIFTLRALGPKGEVLAVAVLTGTYQRA